MNDPTSAENHVAIIAHDLSIEIHKKYMAGQDEHGGKLWRKPVLPFAWEEVLDLPVYLHVLKHQHEEMKQLAMNGLDGDSKNACLAIYNILTLGNAEGVREDGD